MQSKPLEFVDAAFVIGILVLIIMDTGSFLWLMQLKSLNEAVLAIYASFVASTVVGPLSAWVGYRYGSSQGSKNKDDTLSAVMQKATP